MSFPVKVLIVLKTDFSTCSGDTGFWTIFKEELALNDAKQMSRLMTKPTKWHVRPAKTQITRKTRTAKTLIRLSGCPGWSESSLGAHFILLVLSWGGSLMFNSTQCLKISYCLFIQSRAMRKRVLCHMRTTKAQISLRIRAVWSALLLFAG